MRFHRACFVVCATSLALCCLPPTAWSQSDSEVLYRRAVASISLDAPVDRPLAALRKALDAGLERPSRVLVDPDWKQLRSDPQSRKALRALLEDYPRESMLKMVAGDESGQPLRLELAFVDRKSGKPLPGRSVYIYHTDDAGNYMPEAETPGGGNDNPRLFAFGRTDESGHLIVDTILPGAYRGTDAIRHIHLSVTGPEKSEFDTGIYFESNADVDQELREEAASGRIAVGTVQSEGDSNVCKVTFRVPTD